MVARQRADGSVEVGFTGGAMGTKTVIESVAQLAVMVPLEAAEELVDEYRRAEAITPIFDPTGWMRVQGNWEGHYRLATAFLAFRRVVGDLAGEAK